MIGKLERVPLREVWKHEALDFTSWLTQNIDVLNDALGINLTNAESEQRAGSFSVDILAEDDSGNIVVIENQLEKSNHDHLGKLITYVTSVEAKSAVWIVADPRPEHVKAISWLNESTACSFYLLKVEAIQIGESSPAPLLTLIVGPSEESREAGKTKKEMAERYQIRRRFWTQLLDCAKAKTKLHANISPGEYSWVGTSSGKRGLGYNYCILQHESIVELYIDRGKDCDEENKRIFQSIEKSREQIEEVFGGPLAWQILEGKRACRLRHQLNTGGYRDDEKKWPTIMEAMVENMVRLEKALNPHIRKLKLR